MPKPLDFQCVLKLPSAPRPRAGEDGFPMLDVVLPLLLVLTGLTGLVYEVALGRLLALHLGSSGASQAITLATFLGGMSLGALLTDRIAGPRLRKTARPLRLYALLEGAVGLWVLVLPALASAVFSVCTDLRLDPTTPASLGLRLLLAGMVVLPLSSLMGATLPVLAIGLERADPQTSVARISRCYWANAAGAASGAGLAGFVLIESFGLDLTLTLGAMGNLTVAVLAWRILRDVTAPAPSVLIAQQTSPAEERRRVPVPRLVVAALFTGFSALLCEVVWTRLYGLLLGASVYAFAAMLCVVIAGIAGGSALASRMLRRGAHPVQWLTRSQWLAALASLLLCERLGQLPIELLTLRSRLQPVPENYAWMLALGGGWAALHVLPAALLLGASFPLLLATAQVYGARPDRAAAWLLGANTLGNLLGALLGGFFVMPLLGVEWALVAAAIVSLGVAVLVAPLPWTVRQATPYGLVAALGATLLILAPPDGETVQLGLFRPRTKGDAEVQAQVRARRNGRILFRRDGKDASISVAQYPHQTLVFRSNGKSDGSTTDAPTQVVLGHLGFLVQPDARQALVIGLGTGQTAAAIASHPRVQVRVAEMSDAVLEVARLFSAHNGDVLHHPRVRVQVADAREVLASLPDHSLDLVVSEPSNPWVVGVADLYTLEHFQRLRQHLTPRGVLVQWIHTYEMRSETLHAILCTLGSALPHVAVFRLGTGDLALVASPAPLQFDGQRAAAMLSDPTVQFELLSHRDPTIPSNVLEFLSLQLCGPLAVAQACLSAPPALHERFPRLEYEAPRDFFAGADASRLVLALDTRLHAQGDTLLREWLRQVPLTDDNRSNLHTFLKACGQERERPLVAALHTPADLPFDVAAMGSALPADPASVPSPTRKRLCETLQAKVPWLLDGAQTQFGPVPGPWTAWQAACRR